jgi:hypothetical protein
MPPSTTSSVRTSAKPHTRQRLSVRLDLNMNPSFTIPPLDAVEQPPVTDPVTPAGRYPGPARSRRGGGQ